MVWRLGLAITMISPGTTNASESPLRIASGSFSPDGAFKLQTVGSNTLVYRVQTSTNLAQWTSLQTNVATGSLTEFRDLDAPRYRQRFYRLAQAGSGLLLSKNQGVPGELLTLSGGGLDPSAPTFVRFQSPNGPEIKVRSFAVTTGTVLVAIPWLIDTNSSKIRGGLVSVSVQQETTQATNHLTASEALRIADLPQTGLAAGAVTLEYLTQLSGLLSKASGHWQTIGAASQGKVDTASLQVQLLSLKANVDTAQNELQQIINGQTPRLALGRIGGREIYLDRDALALLDQMLAAHLINARAASLSGGGLAARASLRAAATTADCADPLGCIDDIFTQGAGPDAQGIFNFFEEVNTIGGASVGLMAATALVLGLASAPVAATLAGTAGAVLFFTTYVAPAVMGASALSLAAPFIEVATGHQVSIDDYRPALNHIQKGSAAYLMDEFQGQFLKGTLQTQGASEDLIARASLTLGASKSILGLQDLAKPDSVGAQAFANSTTIFAHLTPSSQATTYVGNFSGTLTESYLDAGWRYDISATLTIIVSGQGTIAAPYSGTLKVSGNAVSTLLYCNSSAGCDPGGTVPFSMDDGVISGSFGAVEGLGQGDIGTGSFTIEFSEGKLSDNTLTGTVTFDPGIDQTLVKTVTLTKKP